MRKLILLLLLTVFSTFQPSLVGASSGSYHLGFSQPAVLDVYYADNWSSVGYWQLTDDRLPKKAEITKVKVEWETASTVSSQHYRGLELIVGRRDKLVKLQPSQLGNYAVTNQFSGLSPAGEWGIKYRVNKLQPAGSYLGLTPKLVIYYRVSD